MAPPTTKLSTFLTTDDFPFPVSLFICSALIDELSVRSLLIFIIGDFRTQFSYYLQGFYDINSFHNELKLIYIW